MTPQANNEKHISEFIGAVSKLRCSYRYCAITYAALKIGGQHTIIAATLELSPWPLRQFKSYSSKHLTVDRFDVFDADLNAVIEEVLSGSFRTPDEELLIPAGSSGFYLNQNKSTAYEDAMAVLRIPGCQLDDFIPYELVIPELNSGLVHFSNLPELLQEKGLSYSLGAAVFEIVAWPVVSISGLKKKFGGRVNVSLLLAEDCDADLVTVNGRATSNSSTQKLGSLGGSLTWVRCSKGFSATAVWRIPQKSDLKITASYDSILQQTMYSPPLLEAQQPKRRASWLWHKLQEAYPLLSRHPMVVVFILLGVIFGAIVVPAISELISIVIKSFMANLSAKP